MRVIGGDFLVWQIKGRKVCPAGMASVMAATVSFWQQGYRCLISLSGSLRHKKIPRSGGIKG
ncbi:hypothetical protein XJ20_09845 [Serratia liquefaciens]|nr:hypothetical protein XJ20_09845 [Serratia liquefaciens]